MFDCPEHALAVAFAITELPIEPKSATLLIVEALEARFGVGKVKLASGLSPQDWHAQAVMAQSFAERELASHPIMWSVIVAEYAAGFRGAQAVQAVSNYVAPHLTGTERLLTDYLIMRAFKRKPTLRALSSEFGMAPVTILRRERRLEPDISSLRARAIALLRDPMEECGLTVLKTGA